MLLSGADIVVNTLIEQDCNIVFGYPGGQILDVYESLYKHRKKIRHILTAHEQGAVHAADGYARASGKVGVVISTSGPGATNLITGIATAYLDSVPMVAICGNVPTSQIGTDSFQEIDITGISMPITKHNYFVTDISELAETIREAFALASSDRPGPVLIDIPKDIQTAKFKYVPKGKVFPKPKISAQDNYIKEVAECINKCQRPYIYFGGGLISSGAQEELLTLAQKTDAYMGCSMMGISAIPTNYEKFLGMQGMHGHYAASMAMSISDCIIALGVRFNDRVTGNKENLADKARVIHIDIDASELSKNIMEDYSLKGDIKETLKNLIPLIKEKKRPEWQKKVELLRKEQMQKSDSRHGMTPKNILSLMNTYLSDNTPVVTDVGQHQMWAAQTLCFEKKRKFISNGGLGTMGFGIGAAIGAYFATGEKTVLITGDGSFDMSLQEMSTAVSVKAPLVILIMNNGVLGMVRQWQTIFFNKHYSNSILDRKTDYPSLAKAFGANGQTVTTTEELKTAFEIAFSSDLPYIIDCRIDKDEPVLPMLMPGKPVKDLLTELN
ncbi:MAG: biosynthetic-type acetolactate synthase large subunit [Clostridia bacterium]|nr:biosynthetic-type acetolactate synthase large subunit [Clostridia bacterium]